MARIVVAAPMVRFPLGGMNQAMLTWLVGLDRLGHEVYLVERAARPEECYDPVRVVMTDDGSYGMRVVNDLLDRYGLADRWCFVDVHGVYHGLRHERVDELLRTADVFLDLERTGWGAQVGPATRRVCIDGDGGWTQLLMETARRAGTPFPEYDDYFTVGPNVGTPDSWVPTCGKTWRKTIFPIMLEAMAFEPPRTSDGPFSTVMRWKSNSRVTWDGVTYGQKDVEFPKFVTLPSLTKVPMEIAASGGTPKVLRGVLREAGWRIRPADEVAVTCDSYLNYIRSCRGEFAVQKEVFVATNSGVTPERMGYFMASGRPAVVQDTGFARTLPCGRGLFAVRTVEEAAAAIEAIDADYATHATAARAIAEEFLDSRKVLAALLRDLGL